MAISRTKFNLLVVGQSMSNKIIPDKIEVISERDAAQYIGMSQSFLRQDRMNGFRKKRTKGPVFIRIGRNIRYHISDLDAWLDDNKVRRSTETIQF